MDLEEQKDKEGNKPLYLIVVDETGQADVALHYAVRAAKMAKAGIAVLHVLYDDNSIFMPWGSVSKTIESAQKASAEEFLDGVKQKLTEKNIEPVLYQEEGSPIDAVERVLSSNKNIVKLILAADTSARDPGPLVSHFSGSGLKDLPVALTIVPSHVDLDVDAVL